MSIIHDGTRVERDIAEYRREAREILDRAGNNDLTGADAARFDELAGFIESGQAQLRDLSEQHSNELDAIRTGLASGRMQAFPGSPDRDGDGYDRDPLRDPRDAEAQFRGRNPWNLREMQAFGRAPSAIANELRARALSAVERMPGATDEIREGATRIIERCDSVDSKIARHALITSNPAYVRAWSKVARGDQYSFDDDEKRAWAEADQFRAMSLTDSAGGFLVPFQLDPAVIVTSSGSYGEVRSIARQVIATGDVWNGVSSAAISWSWDAEGDEVSDDSPSIAQPSVPIHKAQGFVPISIEALQDAANVTETVGTLFAEGQSDLEATALVTGSGVGRPTGIITALAAASPSVSIDTAGTATFAQSDVLNLQGALPARWRRKASWLANNLTYNKIRQFDTGGGGGFWTNLNSDRPPLLMGRSAIEAEAVASTITTGTKVAVFGDFSNYVVATRLGMTVELIPHLFGENRRPTGQRGWFAWYRVGADSVNDNAFRLLSIK